MSLSERIKEAQNIIAMTFGYRSAWGLFSGGQDSIVAAHLASQRAEFEGVIHIRTKTGPLSDIASDYALAVARRFGWQVIEKSPFTTFPMLVTEYGFPGPQQHSTMYQMLKERPIDEAKKEARKRSKRSKLVFVTGIRRAESQRRATFPEVQKQKGVYWVCPLINWSNEDVREYMQAHNLHAEKHSRECLCGAFAKPGERNVLASEHPDQGSYWNYLEQIVALNRQRHLMEAELGIRSNDKVIPEHYCIWGHGLRSGELKRLALQKTQITICNDCEGQLNTEGNVGIDPDEMLMALRK